MSDTKNATAWTVNVVTRDRYDSFTGAKHTQKQVWIKSGDGEYDHVAIMTTDDEANAALIVKAVNAHDDLIAACEHAIGRLKRLDEYRKTDSSASIGLVERALAKAKAEE